MGYLYPTVIKPYVDSRERYGGGGGGGGCLRLFLAALVIFIFFLWFSFYMGWIVYVGYPR